MSDQYSISIKHTTPEGDAVAFRTTAIEDDGSISLTSEELSVEFTYFGYLYLVSFDGNGRAVGIRPVGKYLAEMTSWTMIYDLQGEVHDSETYVLNDYGRKALQKCQEIVDDIVREPHLHLLRHTKHIQTVIDRHTARRDTIIDFLVQSGIDLTMKG